MRYTRRYLQFNNLVFDSIDMIKDADGGSVSFKGDSQNYSFGHGAYRPLKSSVMYAEAQEVSMTIVLYLKKLPCEYRPFYKDFAISELSKAGKLWAIEGNTLLWTNAVVTQISQDYSAREDTIEIDVDFELYDGIWRKADKQKTFLVPYDICTLFDCKGYREINPCTDGDCCISCVDKEIEQRLLDDCACCCTDELTKEMALCYHKDLSDFYGICDTPYQIWYDCEKAERFFGTLGAKLCENGVCDGIIAGRFYSETDIPTDDVKITLHGTFSSPSIEINGNENIIKGEYDGTLTILSSGDVYYEKEGSCCDTLLDPSVWSIPQGMTYGFTVKPQNNRVIINANTCCGMACAYIEAQALTY